MLNNSINLGTQWNGTPRFATQQQLLSTAQGLLNDFTFPSSVIVSTFTTLETQLLIASTINTGAFTALNFIADTLSVSTINTNRLNATSISTGFLTTNRITVNTLSTGSITTSSITTGATTISGSLNMCNNNISNVNTITATTGDFTFGLSAPNASFTGITATSANITSLTGGSSGTNGTFADLTVNNNARFNNNITDFTHKTLSNVDTIHSGSNSALVGCNLNLRATNALLGYGLNIELDANQGSLVAANSVITLKAKNGNRGKILLDAEPGYAGIQGEINLTATGGSPPGGVPTLGGRIHLSATNPFPLTSVSPSYVLQTADSILSYAGGLSPIGGNYGYNYVQGLNGVNIVAGTVASIPNVPGSIYMYATNAAGTGNSGGVRVQNGISVDVIYPYPTGFITPSYDLILKGNAAGNKVSLSNVRNIQSDGGDLTGFYTAYSSNLGSQIFTTSNLTASNTGFISSLTVNEIISALPLSFNTLNVLSTAFISSLTVNDIVFSRQREDFGILNVSSLFASTLSNGTATINKLTLPNTPFYSIEQNFFSTSGGSFNTVSTATNSILSTSIQLTAASFPEIDLIDGQVFNNGNLTYWASTIVVARPTQEAQLSNTLGAIAPNTGRLVYRNNSGVPLAIFATFSTGPSGIIVPQGANYGFTYNGSFWDLNTSPDNVGGTFGTSFSLFQTFNNTTLKTPDIITLDSAVVNITGTLGDTDITTANIQTATINQINASNITLANTPSYSIEQRFISTTGSFFNTISSATNYILSTSISLTAATQAQNPIVPNLNIGNSNVDYWASTIQVATDFGAAPSIINALLPLSNGLTGQITYSNASITKNITISRFGGSQPPLTTIPPGSNYQFTYNGTDWLLNQTPPNTAGTSGTSFSMFQTYNNTTLKTPDILTLDAPVVNITGLVNGVNIGTATIQEATVNQIFTSNITMSNTPTYSIEQSFFSTTTEPFSRISSIQNLIISTSTGFATGSQEQQPFIDNFIAGSGNMEIWASTIFVAPPIVDTNINSLSDMRPLVPGGQIDYIARVSPIFVFANGASGGQSFTVPAGSTYRYTWDGNNWNQNTSPPSRSSVFGTSFALFQDYYNTTLKSPDVITIDSASLNITGITKINQLNLNNLDLSTINTSNITASNLTATNGIITNLNTVNENTRIMNYSTITGNLVQGTIGINQNTNYTAIGRTINLASNLQYSVFPNISSIASQNVFNNTINYNKYPGGFFQLMLNGSVGGQVLNADGTIVSPQNITGVSWYSSIMGVAAATAGSPSYYPITAPPTSQRGEFILQGTKTPYSQYQMNVNGTSIQIAISNGENQKWTNSNGSSWTSNFNTTAYPTTNTTETASLVMQPGGLLNINAQYLGFANSLRVVSYSERITAAVQNAGVFGKAQVDNIQVQFQGKKFSSSDYNCTISFNQWGATQANLATNEAAANVYPDAQGNWLYQVRMTTATIPAFGVSAFWQVQILLTPRVFATGTNTTATFSDPEIWAPLEIPGMHVSSMTTSTLTLQATENLIFGAGVGIPTVIGNQGISFTANSNIGLVANNDIGITSYNNMFLTATSSILLSNAAGTAALGFNETGAVGGLGYYIALNSIYDTYISADSNLYLNGSNSINIETLSTIYLQSYNSYTTASNVYDLHNTTFSNVSASNAIHQTPDFIVSTCKNSYHIQNIRQPFIMYGDTTGSNNTGNTQVVLPVPYSSINAYKAFATMEDSEPAEMSVVRNSESTFTIYWQQAASGTHTIAWNTMGDVGGCGGAEPPPPPAEDPAYDLVNDIVGVDMFASWTPGGSPDLYTVYVLQSTDNIDFPNYTSADFYSPTAEFYSLPEGYWYSFYVSSHYGGTRVDSSNATSYYINYSS